MAWVRLDDEFPDHKKVAGLSNDAFCLHVTAMCWVAKWQTDGKLPGKLLGKLGWRCQDPASAAAELVTANVWEITPEGWEIHDFTQYNPTKEQIEALAATRSAAGKAGAMARWQNHSKTDGKSQGKQWQTDGKKMPPSPSPSEDDEESAQALNDLQVLGLFNKPMLDQFNDMWPELSGRRDWIGKAITIARDQGAHSPAYALKVLANSLHTGKEPGYVNGKTPPAPVTHTKPDTAEKTRRFDEEGEALIAEGLHPDNDQLFYPKIEERIEAKYGKQ